MSDPGGSRRIFRGARQCPRHLNAPSAARGGANADIWLLHLSFELPQTGKGTLACWAGNEQRLGREMLCFPPLLHLLYPVSD